MRPRHLHRFTSTLTLSKQRIGARQSSHQLHCPHFLRSLLRKRSPAEFIAVPGSAVSAALALLAGRLGLLPKPQSVAETPRSRPGRSQGFVTCTSKSLPAFHKTTEACQRRDGQSVSRSSRLQAPPRPSSSQLQPIAMRKPGNMAERPAPSFLTQEQREALDAALSKKRAEQREPACRSWQFRPRDPAARLCRAMIEAHGEHGCACAQCCLRRRTLAQVQLRLHRPERRMQARALFCSPHPCSLAGTDLSLAGG